MSGPSAFRRPFLRIVAALVFSSIAATLLPIRPAIAAGLVEHPTVIGGKIAPNGRWPFVVGLLTARQDNNFAAQFCAGSLVHGRYVLTAAHCVDAMAARQLDVLVGTQDLSKGGRRIRAARILVHPGYDALTGDNDVALIRLSKAVTGIRPAKLLSLPQEGRRAAPGTPSMAAGWGDVDPSAKTAYPERLHNVRFKMIATARCNGAEAYNGAVTPTMICAGVMAGGRDTCQGDSGGPLVVRDSQGRFRLQAGIVSWGNGCAEPGFPGVYSRVAFLNAWIRSTIAAGR